MGKADALQAIDAIKPFQRARVLRADTVHENFVQLADLARIRHREGQHIPERKSKIVHQHFTPRIRLPFGGVE